MERPIPFIIWDKSKSDEPIVNEEAVRIISNYRKPIFVVSIVGAYRTGKSFLLNTLMGRNDGFPLGSTIMSETKGIWMWIKDHPRDPNKAVLLLDTEGLNDAYKGDVSNDAEIFTLTILLSSVLVFNTQGRIDENALQGLHLAGELTDHIKSKGSNGEDFAQFFPNLIWAIRDFGLELKLNGKNITEDEYLESCLNIVKGRGSKLNGFNEIRLSIREFFPHRHCVVFPTPTTPDKLTLLDMMKLDDLEANFKEAAQKFEKAVFGINRVKTVENKPIDGSAFVALAKEYCSLIGSGFINISSAHSNLITKVNGGALQDAKNLFEEKMSMSMPISDSKLELEFKSAYEASMDLFRSKVISIEKNQQYLIELEAFINEYYGKVKGMNKDISYDRCLALLKSLYEPLENEISNNVYAKPGGSLKFEQMVNQLLLDYESRCKTQEVGPCQEFAVKDFISLTINPMRKNISKADAALTKKEQEKQEAEMKANEAIRANQLAEKEMKDMIQKQKDRDDMHKKNMESFRKDMEKQRNRDWERHQIQLENERKEAQRLLAEGRKEEARLREEETKRLENIIRETTAESKRKEEQLLQSNKQMLEKMEKQHQDLKDQLARSEAQASRRDDSYWGPNPFAFNPFWMSSLVPDTCSSGRPRGRPRGRPPGPARRPRGRPRLR